MWYRAVESNLGYAYPKEEREKFQGYAKSLSFATLNQKISKGREFLFIFVAVREYLKSGDWWHVVLKHLLALDEFFSSLFSSLI